MVKGELLGAVAVEGGASVETCPAVITRSQGASALKDPAGAWINISAQAREITGRSHD
jgi:hypothetical protein